MSIGRITDPRESMKKDNLSLDRLIQSVAAHADDEFRAGLNERMKNVRKQCEPIMQWRNRNVGHNDLATALQYHPNPLPNINAGDIDDAIRVIAELMNEIQMRFENNYTHLGAPLVQGDGMDLIHTLNEAIEYRLARRKSLTQGMQ